MSESKPKLPAGIYRPCYEASDLWVRPLAMFIELVSIAGELVPRFAYQSGKERQYAKE